jgi:hypothetical protein
VAYFGRLAGGRFFRFARIFRHGGKIIMTTDQHKKELEAQKKASAETNAKRLADYNATLATTASNEAKAKFTLTTYQPPTDGLTLEEARKLDDNDLLTALKKQREIAAKSSFLFHRDVAQLVVIYDATVERYSAQGASGAARNGKPTLREAFTVIGWNYDAARTMKRRFTLAHDPVPTHCAAPKLPQLTTGELVMVKDSQGVYVVAGNVDLTSGKVPVVPQGDKNAKPRSIDIDSLKKVTVPRKKIKIGDLVIFADEEEGTVYRYSGDGKFVRTKTPSVAQTKAEKAAIAQKTKQERLKKEDEKKRRNVEVTRRDLDKIANAKAAQVRVPKKAPAKAAIKPAANTKTVKVEKVDGTQDFGVFPDHCTEYTAANSLTIGTKQMCKTECERINAKRKAVASAA